MEHVMVSVKFIEEVMPNLTGNCLKLYLHLIKTEGVFDMDEICDVYGVSKRTVNNWVLELERNNIIGSRKEVHVPEIGE